MGDSLAAGTHDPSPGYADLGWCDRLAGLLRRVHPDLAYLNTATIGSTAAGTLDRQLGPVLEFRPDLLHISCGANDLWRTAPDLTAIEQTMRQLFERAATTGALLTTFTLGKAFVVPGFQSRRSGRDDRRTGQGPGAAHRRGGRRVSTRFPPSWLTPPGCRAPAGCPGHCS
ncbi:MAG TPA: GDSL-type esterase/lipase family protein [Nonomuraea sp.]|nr:GDSL-type esterase/lipase family protein [Nonomuraea sp.]